MSKQKDKDFLKLQKTWYKKLAKSGFDDIEQDPDNLKIWTGHRIKAKYSPVTFQAKEEYYQLAGTFLNEHKFDTILEKLVWGYHAEGLRAQEIVDRLKSEKIRVHRLNIHKIVKKLVKEMRDTCLIKKT